jgi:hypothetical protein
MFHPLEQPLERGWPGRVDGEHVVQLAAQTLQSFFTGGGSAREHAVWPLDGVRLLAPVLHPPSVRMFDTQTAFSFANPTAILGPEADVVHRTLSDGLPLDLRPRLAAVLGAGGALAGLTILAEWRAPTLLPPKDRDFALGTGPVVVTLDAAAHDPEAVVRVSGAERLRGRFDDFDWAAAHDLAGDGASLLPGDLVVGPELGVVDALEPEDAVEIEVEGIGTLRHTLRPEVELS